MKCPLSTTAIATAIALLTVLSSTTPAVATSPWDLLTELRQNLETKGPITGRFQQTYIPAGFSDGDTESGHLSLWLPRCLRWNYEEPENKSFLLCDEEVFFWNADESSGRHYSVRPEEEPGLDLLLMDVSRLKERYIASSEKLDDGTYRISLTLPPDAEGRWSARIRIEPVAHRVVGLEYTDGEGNLTRFEISDYQTLQHTALFQPPQDIEWIDE
jgi:outer membrane lipoprotein-sorting protein